MESELVRCHLEELVHTHSVKAHALLVEFSACPNTFSLRSERSLFSRSAVFPTTLDAHPDFILQFPYTATEIFVSCQGLFSQTLSLAEVFAFLLV